MPDEIDAVNSSVQPQPAPGKWDDNPVMRWLAGSAARRVYLLAALLCLAIIGLYVWLVSVGFWTAWPAARPNRSPNYYDWLATAFQHGQLALEIKPDPKLLQLPDPYNPKARRGVPFPLDLSLYNGKFYLYWGPIPGVILAVAKTFFPHQVGDQYLVFAFVSGLLIVDALIVIEIWRRFFQNIPGWIVLFCILLIGLVDPLPLLLFNPAIYEAAIAGGQFFFMGGFFLALTALVGPRPSNWRLALAGLSWACAVGCRTTLGLPVAAATLVTMLWLVRLPGQGDGTRRSVSALMALGVPLGLGLLASAWYNWARFGSPLETGLYYQLAGHNIQKDYSVLFSLAYIPQNIFNYLCNPLGFRSAFPFLKPQPGGMQTASLHLYVIPKAYVPGTSMGLFLTSPFVLFAVIPLITTLSGFRNTPVWKRLPEGSSKSVPLHWVSLCLLAASASAFLLIMMYYSVAARYLADFIPAVALLSVIGFWQGYGLLSQAPAWRRLYTILGIGLILYTMVLSVPLALADNIQRFYSFNPILLTQIRHSSIQLINALSPAPWLWFWPK